MSQLSKPYQYALIAMVVLVGAWMLVLRPSDDVANESPTAAATGTAPGVTGLTGAIDKAQSAVGAAPRGAARPGAGSTGSAAAKPSGAVPAKATVPAGDPSREVLDAVAKGAVAVIVFYEPSGPDDRSVRRALRALPLRDGRVRVFSAPIDEVGRYAAITRGVAVLAAPTVLVIARDRTARTITGLTDVGEIDQLVGDALRGGASVATGAAPVAPRAA